jgi:serine/threonine protein kinase
VKVDQRTDIFLLGMLFYELLTNTHPFLGPTQTHTAHNVLNETPVSPQSLNPEIPAAISEVILKCLNKDMNLRFRSCSEMLLAFEEKH